MYLLFFVKVTIQHFSSPRRHPTHKSQDVFFPKNTVLIISLCGCCRKPVSPEIENTKKQEEKKRKVVYKKPLLNSALTFPQHTLPTNNQGFFFFYTDHSFFYNLVSHTQAPGGHSKEIDSNWEKTGKFIFFNIILT